ncbi:MAG: GTP 3',8-cyclase MoaA [Candidatus Bathyarchaeota archaeon]|jgi:cyclic pyranopterin phosphate synthase
MTVQEISNDVRSGSVHDRYGRRLNSIRISLTQRCNLRCFYCHKEGENISVGESEMKTEEITEIAKIACELGMKKIKLTGGEPLLRLDLPQIIAEIAKYADEVSMTTNGVLLKEHARNLSNAGLKRVNVSLPSLSPEGFMRITKQDYVNNVKEGIETAIKSNLHPVKLNMVMLKGINIGEIPQAIEYAQHVGAILQLIEFQPIQTENHIYWKNHHYDPDSLERRLQNEAIKTQENPLHKRKRYILERNDSTVWVEVVRPMHNSLFCQNCTRLRVTSNGKLKPCLLRNDNLVDVVSLIRTCDDPSRIRKAFQDAILLREPYWRIKEESQIHLSAN